MSQQETIRRRILDTVMSMDNLNPNPLTQFEAWLNQAREAGIRYPNAMSLATVNAEGIPFQRFVMLKQFDKNGFVFFSSLSSRKAEQIKANSNVSVLLPWHMLERQVQIQGRAEKLSKLEVLEYFSSRPKSTQLAVWLSQQSSPVSSRGMLESKLEELKARFAEGDVSMPSFWGGYRIIPQSYEFWQTGQDTVNDRFIYGYKDGQWELERMIP